MFPNSCVIVATLIDGLESMSKFNAVLKNPYYIVYMSGNTIL